MANVTTSTEPFLKHLRISKAWHVVLTAETDDFDEETTLDWQEEGFDTVYVPLGEGGDEYIRRLHAVADSETSINERPGLSDAHLAFGEAASACLEGHRKSVPRLAAIVAYYPTSIPDPKKTSWPPGIHVLVHLCGSSIGLRRNHEILGIQGKRRTIQRRMPDGIGVGGEMRIGFPAYVYKPPIEAGFAETDLDEFDPVARELAWSRSILIVRRAFGVETDVEGIRDAFVDATTTGSADTAIDKLDLDAHVLHTPTMTGGFNARDLKHFYNDFFAPSAGLITTQLLSRTVGADRVVDEMHISFDHKTEMPWILPGIPPTRKHVNIMIVSTVCVKAGRLMHEHVYWDQASVLVQVGLLDPNVVPEKFKKDGVKRLPVVGAEAAKAVLNENGKVNELTRAIGG